MKTKDIGKKYENFASEYLIKNSYKILKQNYNSRYGEIDIICTKEKKIIFVEVRFRKNKNYGGAEFSISLSKKKKIYLTALDFLNKNNYEDFEIRFDVIAINAESVNWIKDCIRGDEIGF